MNVLWITNILFPEADAILNGNNELRASGGWMLGLANALQQVENIKLYVASVSNKVKELTIIRGTQIVYYVIPYGKGNRRINNSYIPFWKQIYREIEPDIIHVHGTELSQGFSCLKACGNNKVVISIQGLTSACSKYYNSDISIIDVLRNTTFRDIIRGNILSEKKEYSKRAVYEREMIRISKYVIGRTSWDYARVYGINPYIKYYHCDEILRDEFYDDSIWNHHNCIKYSIFISQASYPIKGLHQLLKAMPIILQNYPNVTIRIAGGNIINKNILRLTGYGNYIKKLIKKHNLENRISFLGNLNALEMKNEYLNCNVFICPSSIENSPNSLCEAQILGVPCVASYVGGIPDLMKGAESQLYRFEEVEMLARKVCTIFENENVYDRERLRIAARKRHNVEKNIRELLLCYNEINARE